MIVHESTPMELAQIPSPSASTLNSHPVDRHLRDFGFTIKDRPEKGPDVWVRCGKPFTTAQAVAVANRLQQERKRSTISP